MIKKPILTLFKDVINDQIEKIEKGDITLKIPELKGLKLIVPGMLYHLTPELFIQLDSSSCFTFPDEEFNLEAGELCIVPASMPHRDKSQCLGKDFLNIVGGAQENTFSLHTAIAQRSDSHTLCIKDIMFFKSNHLLTLEACLNDIVIFYHKPNSEKILKGLMLTVFSLIANMLEEPSIPHRSGCDNIARCMDMINIYLFHHELNVRFVANKISLSPDYLSNLFVKNQNLTIIEYINKQRVNIACKYLKNTSLNVSEISWACGYKDPAYFARVFKRIQKVSPGQYRNI